MAGIWILDGANGECSEWYCSECGYKVRMEHTWDCPTTNKCPNCNEEMLIPEDIEHEWEMFVD